MGEIIISENKDDKSAQFVAIIGKFDKSFSRQLTKKDKQLIKANWQEKDVDKIKTIADLIYNYFRNFTVYTVFF